MPLVTGGVIIHRAKKLKKDIKKIVFPLTIIITHTVLVGLIFWGIVSSNDSEAEMLWAIFFIFDFPTSFLAKNASSNIEYASYFIFIGCLHWGILGLIIQKIIIMIIKGKRKKQLKL